MAQALTASPDRIPFADAPDPLDALERVASLPYPVLLDGAADRAGLGRWSYLMVDPAELLQGPAEEWPAARERIRRSIDGRRFDPETPPFQGGWVGWLGYELGRAFDRQPVAAGNRLAVPEFSLARYDALVAWDHARDRAWLIGKSAAACDRLRAGIVRDRRSEIGDPRSEIGSDRARGSDLRSPISDLPRSTFTPDAYRDAVRAVIERILRGDIFQANLAQQFTVPFTGNPVSAYRAMRGSAAGSHAAYLARDGHTVLSMSPELFLRLEPATRRIETRPIKGTRPRHPDPGRDAAAAAELLGSEKDRAENVMIVDLMRNDLNRVAVPGSVEVPALCRLESFAAVHHLVSVITGRLRPDRDALDLVAAAFPAGSITGAPKLRATAILAELEPERRGVYCGAIGWIGLDGGMELSVAIRTVTVTDGAAVVPAGGGVTVLSDPDEEYRETLDKARALLAAFGVAA